jgi:hypothetical protein
VSARVLERGDIFFLYRPRVGEDQPAGLVDVQRFFIVLRPQHGACRLLVVGRKRLQKEFHGRRFEGEDVRLLDCPGAEFVLIGARLDPERAYGMELETEKEDYGHAEIIRDLRMERSRHPVQPLFEGPLALDFPAYQEDAMGGGDGGQDRAGNREFSEGGASHGQAQSHDAAAKARVCRQTRRQPRR